MESLVASSSTFKKQMVSLVSPHIYQNMRNLFSVIEKYNKEAGGSGSIETFQEELKSFVSWSGERIAQETKRLVEQSKCNYLDKLLMRILSDEAKILAFGRTIALDYPSLNDYTHRVYVELAKSLYSNPHLFYMNGLSSFSAHKNYTCAMNLIENAMDSAIRHFLPLEDILDYTLEVEDQGSYNNLEDAYDNYQYESDSSIPAEGSEPEDTISELEVDVNANSRHEEEDKLPAAPLAPMLEKSTEPEQDGFKFW